MDDKKKCPVCGRVLDEKKETVCTIKFKGGVERVMPCSRKCQIELERRIKGRIQ